MKLIVNGSETTLEFDPPTVAGLLAVRKPNPPFAVEVNKQLVRRTTYSDAPLREGDRVEIVSLVGGG